MRFKHLLVLAAATFACAAATAEVVTADPGGFKIATKVVVDASREEAWRAAIKQIDKWWSADHTLSGDAGRLQIDATPQGCFCETLGKNSGAVHMTVTMVAPPTILRLTGGLGPLGLMGVQGNMTWEFDRVEEKTQITFTYVVGGYRAGGLEALAEPVDGVISDALRRLQAYIDTGNAEYGGIE
jgi:uncharacterized protein YndB with AHSA1/START domain